MTRPETSVSRAPDGIDAGIVHLTTPEGMDGMIEAQCLKRLGALNATERRGRHATEALPQVYQEALDAFAWGLEPKRSIGLEFAFEGTPKLSLYLRFSAKAQNRRESERLALELQEGFNSALAAAGIDCWLAEESGANPLVSPAVWRTEILPPGLRLENTHSANGSHFYPSPQLHYDACTTASGIIIAPPRSTPPIPFDSLLLGLAAVKIPVRMAISLRARIFTAEELRLLTKATESHLSSFTRTDALPPLTADEVAEPVGGLLRRFEREGKAIEISVRIEAAKPLCDALLNLAASIFWGTHQFSKEHNIGERDWRRLLPLGYRLPQWLPSPAAMESLGIPVRATPSHRQSCQGTLLGRSIDGTNIRLSDDARSRHVYCCGATGSGKSTLLANMVLQDIATDRGLILVDPHGDIVADVLARVPATSVERVVALDLADPDFAPGINVLATPGPDPELAKPLICGELLRIFKNELFPDVPEAFGPMFELYYRNAIMLLLEAEDTAGATIVDLPRIFQDDAYRKLLIESCANRHVRDFWTKTVDRVTHDEVELPNIAPYVVAKFEPFLGSRSIRTIVGQHDTTLDFGKFMDDGKVVLISLAKGVLGSNEARVLALLLLQQIQIACMARVRTPREKRRPITLYVDEAQSFVGGALTELLAEARKFGLSLVLANQTMAQLSSRTSRAFIDVLLGNVANLLVLRVGIRDADILAPWLRPHTTVDDLIGMPDFNAIARILDGNRPSDPLMISLLPLPEAMDASIAKAILSGSRAAYCRPRDDIEACLRAR